MTEKMIEQQYRVVMGEQVRTIERLERRISELKEENAELSARLALLEKEPDNGERALDLPDQPHQNG